MAEELPVDPTALAVADELRAAITALTDCEVAPDAAAEALESRRSFFAIVHHFSVKQASIDNMTLQRGVYAPCCPLSQLLLAATVFMSSSACSS